jgi:hypothetical protein
MVHRYMENGYVEEWSPYLPGIQAPSSSLAS